MLNKVQIGNIDDDVENLLKARFIYESDENYPKDALHMYAENEQGMKRNEAIFNELPGELDTVEANDKIPANCKYTLALIQTAQNVILTVNIDIQDRLINDETGIIRHIEFA